ncbi:MAG TPA: NAD(P)-dependent oxidoreductase [Methanoculleus thermophilus]|nr:NAD(P)-dependent oxidoreductase [Methanoculleus thermophilus]
MSKGVAVVGATSFIGRAILSSPLSESENISACSKNGGTIGNVVVDNVDLTDYHELSDWLEMRDVDSLMYLSSVIPCSFLDSTWNLLDQNLTMHRNILRAWKESACHLIYASSCSVYGRDSPLPWRESNMTMPDNLYAISKLFGEILFYNEYQHGLPLTVLRINAPYGVQNRRKTVVNIFIENALDGADILLHGTGAREQDFIYVRDVAQAFWLAHSQKKSGIYNIASGKTVTMLELAKMIVTLADSGSKIVYSGQEDPQEGLKVSIDISKAHNHLGFYPEYSLMDGLAECIQNYREISGGNQI